MLTYFCLQLCLRCAVELVKAQPKSAETFVTCISSLLTDMKGWSDGLCFRVVVYLRIFLKYFCEFSG